MASTGLPKVALLGRPNVGKSTLFNRLIRSNRAITHDQAGITRDRMDGVVKTRGEEPYGIIDTGGVTMDSHAQSTEGPAGIRGFEAAILDHAKQAIAESSLLCLVVDGRDGLTPYDQHLAEYLRKVGKPLLLVVNKIDGPDRVDLLLAEFHVLGLDMHPCSAAHGFNVRELEDTFRSVLFPMPEVDDDIMRQMEEELHLEGATKRQKKRLVNEFLARKAKNAGDAAQDDAEDDEDALLNEELLGITADADDAEDAEDFEAADLTDVVEECEADEQNEGDSPVLLDGSTFDPEAVYFEGEEIPVVVEGTQDLYGGPLRVALLGRPNAGKSSLVNALTQQSRMIVSDVAGTTRDSVDVTVSIDGEECTFVDTAGVRRRAKITDVVERYSVNSSLKSTTKAHVTLLVVAAEDGLTQQDKRLIDLLVERKTPFMVLINKSDLIDHKERKNVEHLYKDAMVFCPHVPVIFVSAVSGFNLHKIIPLARSIRQECGIRIGTGKINRSLEHVLTAHQPPIVKSARPKFFYMTQAESCPPTFIFFVSDADRILPSYARYLEKALRKMFGITHAPMRIHFRSSHKKRKK